MTKDDLLTLADREAQRLTDENDHSAAVIIRNLCAVVRGLPPDGGLTYEAKIDAGGADAATVDRLERAIAEDRKRFAEAAH